MFCWVQKLWPHFFDVGGCVVLGEWVSQVVFARAIVNEELVLSNAVFEPVPPHVHGFGPLLFHGAIGKPFRSSVVDLHWGGWLGMSELS